MRRPILKSPFNFLISGEECGPETGTIFQDSGIVLHLIRRRLHRVFHSVQHLQMSSHCVAHRLRPVARDGLLRCLRLLPSYYDRLDAVLRGRYLYGLQGSRLLHPWRGVLRRRPGHVLPGVRLQAAQVVCRRHCVRHRFDSFQPAPAWIYGRYEAGGFHLYRTDHDHVMASYRASSALQQHVDVDQYVQLPGRHRLRHLRHAHRFQSLPLQYRRR